MNENKKAIIDSHLALCDLARQVGLLAQSCGNKLRVAESCTGGMLAAALTDSAGASAWFECGVVCYSDQAKIDLLNLSPEVLQKHGAVSEETAAAMCRGAGDFSIAITGIAGPDGGSDIKPIGTVCFGWQVGGVVNTERRHFTGTRQEVRTAAAMHALRVMGERLRN